MQNAKNSPFSLRYEARELQNSGSDVEASFDLFDHVFDIPV
jgi:hypothetical protein